MDQVPEIQSLSSVTGTNRGFSKPSPSAAVARSLNKVYIQVKGNLHFLHASSSPGALSESVSSPPAFLGQLHLDGDCCLL